MKNLKMLFLGLFISSQILAQDIIVKNDKTEIKAKIEELTESMIKYKKMEMLDGPSYNINKQDVFMIIYKNGSKEYMENKNAVREDRTMAQKTNKEIYKVNSNELNNGHVGANEGLEEITYLKNNRILYKGNEHSIKGFRQIMNEIGDPASKMNYSEAVAQIKLGQIITMSGGTLVGVSAFVPKLSIIGTAGGLIAATVGYVIFNGGLKAVKTSVRSYNDNLKRRVGFAPIFSKTQNGGQIGLKMTF